MTLLVDTSVWSLAFRRDVSETGREVQALRGAIERNELVATTGVIVLELLRGLLPGRAKAALVPRLSVLTMVEPTKTDYFEAAELINSCRRRGVRLGTVDALIAQLAIANDLTLLTTDRDFTDAARHIPLRLWSATH